MGKIKKVLICMSSLSKGNGIATFIMSNYDNLIKNNYKIDFLLMHKGISNLEYLKYIDKNRGKVFFVEEHNLFDRFNKTAKAMKLILEDDEYDIVHVNLIDIYAYACIKLANKMNIKKIIYHVHNPKRLGKLLFLSQILNQSCINMATDLYACTEYAGKSMFGKNKFYVVKNTFDTSKYTFNEKYRREIREKYNISDKILIGSIGRIVSQKNPLYTLKIIKELIKLDEKIHFIWIGIGNMKNIMEKYISKYKMGDKVKILDHCDEINKMYSALDVFLLPSKYEGLGIVFIEAQCSGLKVYTSDKVPKDIEITNLVRKISLKMSPKKWAEYIYKDLDNVKARNEYIENVKKEYDYSTSNLLYFYE